MQPKSPESPPTPEGEPLANMNNFHLYLPEGSHRQYQNARGAKMRTQVMEAMDQLLATEFSHLDTAKISQTIKDTGQAVADIVNSGRFQSKELELATEPHFVASDQAREQLRPLFNKLVEMGFDPKVLAS
jgi:hypothetical protein